MKTEHSSAEPAFGFLTVIEDAAAGMLGGLLVVNRRGRPLEFHCTAPVLPSRAEEILFGPTLRPHFFCERIGAALLKKVSTSLSLVVVHQLDCWPVGEETTLPVVLADQVAGGAETTAERSPSDAESQRAMACLDRLDPSARPQAQQLLDELVRYVDLAEPFDRIVEAIREAGLLGSPATDEGSATDREPTADTNNDHQAGEGNYAEAA